MALPTTGLSESSPAGSDIIALGDNKIREYKVQNREILEVDHVYPTSGQSDDCGKHKKLSLIEIADLGTGTTGYCSLGAQTVSGKPELIYTDEDDNDIQITSVGKIKLSSGRLENNVNLISRNQAGNGDVNLLKANTSNQAEITPALLSSGGTILPEITAPTTAANQGALYTKNDGTQTELYFREESDGDEVQITKSGGINLALGDWTAKDIGTTYQALTDGFVIISGGTGASPVGIQFVTDSDSSPTTIRARIYNNGSSGASYFSLMSPVKKNDYYLASNINGAMSNVTYYFISLS